jgi:predicted NodU family carbamoyl transferase
MPSRAPASASIDEIADRLSEAGAHFTSFDDDTLLERTVDRLDRGDAGGWFQDRMEAHARSATAPSRVIRANPISRRSST